VQDEGFPVRFAVGVLATWRVTHLLVAEDGPADIVVRLRRQAGDSWIGDALDCFYCLSVWTAVPIAVAVARSRREAPLTWLALSGAACLLERATEKGDIDVLWEQAQEDATPPELDGADARVAARPNREREASAAR
jgi:hypothetical protein